jgi:hypothetical protein
MSEGPAIAVGTVGGLMLFGSQQTTELQERKVRALYPNETELWAVVDDHNLVRRDSSGAWEGVAEVADLRLNCVLPVDGTVLAGTSLAHLLSVDDGRAETVSTFEAAPGREDWFTPWGGPPDVRSLDADDENIYANVHVGGILRSDPRLQSWEPTLDINSDVHEVHVAKEVKGLVLAACSWGLAVSRDGADSWTFHTDGMHAHYCRAVVASGGSILITASLGPRGGHSAVYRCPLERPEDLEKCEAGLPEWFADNIDTGCLAARADVAAFGADGEVFMSHDAGASWTSLASGLPDIQSIAILDAR